MGNSMHIVGFSVTELSSQRQLSAFGELMNDEDTAWNNTFVGVCFCAETDSILANCSYVN